ncbi:MAG TPA: nucleoside deaminase [bacterium]|nr:nucleoside deaminase [bacterium]HPJ71377.1 nucleoside deaminase [bacterium]HPQ66435.1 nucleoside deaminase [bacterium]
MTGGTDARHGERMRALAEFTASSFHGAHPSPFGAAVYDASGALVAQAVDTVMKECDPTAHAEMNALRRATSRLRRLSLRGCILYSTCEPCPMCMSACLWAEVDAVVYGASTMEDAHPYWPQSSDLTPAELAARALADRGCEVVPHVERLRCRELFRRCDEIRKRAGLPLPPHR